MYQKPASLLLTVLMALSLSGCGGNAQPPAGTANLTKPTAAATESTQTQPTEEPDGFGETVVIDDEQCTFALTGLGKDSLWGYTLMAQMENKTDKELMFSLDNVSINGFMCDPFWAKTVTAGMKANEEIHFSDQDFRMNGITDVTQITFTLNIYDSNDLTADRMVSQVYTLYPKGEEAVLPYARTPVEGENVLFDNEKCTMIVTGYEPDSTWGYRVHVYLENKTDKNLMFSVSDAAINGMMCDPFWATTVAPGMRSNTAISWLTSDLEKNGIEAVESISLPVRVYNEDDWTADDILSETFTLTP